MWEHELIDDAPAAESEPGTPRDVLGDAAQPPAAAGWQEPDPAASRWWLRDRTEAALREQARRLRDRTA